MLQKLVTLLAFKARVCVYNMRLLHAIAFINMQLRLSYHVIKSDWRKDF